MSGSPDLLQVVLTIGAHMSPLELKIRKKNYPELSPFELDIAKGYNAELIQMVNTIGAHWSPLESIGVGD
jgi:hypothetical protein